jgi:hypothetical protein
MKRLDSGMALYFSRQPDTAGFYSIPSLTFSLVIRALHLGQG